MEKAFVNFTNHPSEYWEEKQLKEALKYGKIYDLPFPAADPWGDEDYICRLADEYTKKIARLNPEAVLCQGEFCLAYQVACRLEMKGIPVLAACSERNVRVDGQKKEILFSFCQFRRFQFKSLMP